MFYQCIDKSAFSPVELAQHRQMKLSSRQPVPQFLYLILIMIAVMRKLLTLNQCTINQLIYRERLFDC